MADITMCKGGTCPMRHECYRHTAQPSEHRQAYFVEEPHDSEMGTCEYFWPVKNPKPTAAADEFDTHNPVYLDIFDDLL